MRVICDTNIWYQIGCGKIDPKALPDSTELIATYSNLHELASTHKLHRSPVEVKNASQALLEHASSVEKLDPFHHILSLASGRSTIDDSAGKALYKEIQNLTVVPDRHLEDWIKQNRQLLKDYTDDFDLVVGKLTDHINDDLLPQVRRSVSSPTSDILQRQKEYAITQRAVITQWVEMVTGHTLPSEFDWSLLDLMLGASAQFNTTLELTERMKMHANDWHDFLNMSYVAPGQLYWTREKKWNDYIEAAGLADYLFDLRGGPNK